MAFCINCGTQVEEGKRYCENCSAVFSNNNSVGYTIGNENTAPQEPVQAGYTIGNKNTTSQEAVQAGYTIGNENTVSQEPVQPMYGTVNEVPQEPAQPMYGTVNEVPQEPVQPMYGTVNQSPTGASQYNQVNQNYNFGQTNASANYQSTNTSANQNVNYNNILSDGAMTFGDYIKAMGMTFIKPIDVFKNNSQQLSKIKNSALITTIVAAIITIISLIKSMFNAVYKKTYNFWDGEYETEIDFSNLGDLDYIKIIGGNLLGWLGIIVLIAGVYFIGSLIVKKQVSFSKLLGVSALSIIPLVACMMIFAPLFGLIHSYLGTLVTVVGFVYTFVILYEAINSEIVLDGNIKCYFNLICLTIIMSVSAYVYMKIALSGISKLLSMF